MSFDSVPSKVEVMGWKPHQLSDYLRRMDLTGCDKVVLKYSINGARFLNMSENDLQKFPKLHAPLISKISCEMSRKEEKKGLFGKRSTPKYHEPETPVEDQCWGPDEFDVSDDDYLSPNADDDDSGSGGDYESPTEDFEQNEGDYEPPPSEPQDNIPSQFGAALPMGDSEYIDNRSCGSSQAKPPVVLPRPGQGPPVPAPARPGLMEPPPPKREQSPQRPGRLTLPGKILPGLPGPQVDRRTKPTVADRGPNISPLLARRPSPIARPVTHSQSWRSSPEERGGPELPRLPKPPLPASSVSRSSSSVVRGTGPRFLPNSRSEVQEEGASPKLFSSNTFPLHSAPRGMAPRPPGASGPPTHSDSLSPLASTGSLPHRLQEAMNSHRSSARMGHSVSLRPPLQPSYPPPTPAQPNYPPPTPAQPNYPPPTPVQPSYPPPTPVQPSYPPPTPVQPSYPSPPPVQRNYSPPPQGMDTRWYVGQVKREKAQRCLREVNKDGAFLVRDSSKGSLEQPYTLMVLYQDKVYNIQIKLLNDHFLLGTGLNAQETFPSVSEMISHYQQMPLVLIDTKNRSASQQNQCPLMYPAGF